MLVDLEVSHGRLTVRGELLDLGVGGLRVWLKAADAPAVRDAVLVHLVLPNATLALSSWVIYTRGQECGLRILPLLDSAAQAARDKLLGRYLMDQQRRGKEEKAPGPVALRLFRGD